MKPVTRGTNRLRLRELDESDWRAVHEYAADPEVIRYVQFGPNTVEETRSFIARAMSHRSEEPRTSYTLAIVLKDEGRLIGTCGLNVSSPENREGWIGYCLNRRFWGKGYAPEAARALLGWGFVDLGLHRITATCDPENTRSVRVLEKIGMLREGRLRQHKLVKGRWRDSYVYAMLEQEWNGVI